MQCPECKTDFDPVRHQRYCSEKCRVRAWHRRRLGFQTDAELQKVAKQWKKEAIKAVMQALDPILASLDKRIADLEQLEIDAQIEGPLGDGEI